MCCKVLNISSQKFISVGTRSVPAIQIHFVTADNHFRFLRGTTMRSLLGNEFNFSTNCIDDREGGKLAILKSMIDSRTRFGVLNLNPSLSTIGSSSWL
jgi:hypothetical protein